MLFPWQQLSARRKLGQKHIRETLTFADWSFVPLASVPSDWLIKTFLVFGGTTEEEVSPQ